METVVHKNKTWNVEYFPAYSIYVCNSGDGCWYTQISGVWYKFGPGIKISLLLSIDIKCILYEVCAKFLTNHKQSEKKFSEQTEAIRFKTYSDKNCLFVFKDIENTYLKIRNSNICYRSDEKTWLEFDPNLQWQPVTMERNAFLEDKYDSAFLRRFSPFFDSWTCKSLLRDGFTCYSGRILHFVRNFNGEWGLTTSVFLNKHLSIEKRTTVEFLYFCATDQLQRSEKSFQTLERETDMTMSQYIFEFLYDIPYVYNSKQTALEKTLVSKEKKECMTERLKTVGKDFRASMKEEDCSDSSPSAQGSSGIEKENTVEKEEVNKNIQHNNEELDKNSKSSCEKMLESSTGGSVKLRTEYITSTDVLGSTSYSYRHEQNKKEDDSYNLDQNGSKEINSNAYLNTQESQYTRYDKSEIVQHTYCPQLNDQANCPSLLNSEKLLQSSNEIMLNKSVKDTVPSEVELLPHSLKELGSADTRHNQKHGIEKNKPKEQQKMLNVWKTSSNQKEQDTSLNNTSITQHVDSSQLDDEMNHTTVLKRRQSTETDDSYHSVSNDDKCPFKKAREDKANVRFINKQEGEQKEFGEPCDTSSKNKLDYIKRPPSSETSNTVHADTFSNKMGEKLHDAGKTNLEKPFSVCTPRCESLKTKGEVSSTFDEENALKISHDCISNSAFGKLHESSGTEGARDNEKTNKPFVIYTACETKSLKSAAVQSNQSTLNPVPLEHIAETEVGQKHPIPVKPKDKVSESVESDVKPLHERERYLDSVLLAINRKLKEYYCKKYHWVSSLNWLKDGSCFHFGFKIEDDSHFIRYKGFCTLPFQKILIQGNAGFGKSALCALMTKDWCEDKVKDFNLCFYVPLSKVKQFDSLLDILIDIIYEDVQEKSYNKETLAAVLKNAANRILMICDELDQISFGDKSKFLNSVSQLQVMKKIKIIITSRQTVTDESTLKSFHMFKIAGFCFDQLTDMCLKRFDKKQIIEFGQKSKAFYLNDFPPKYLYYVFLYYNQQTHNTFSLYNLLHYIITTMLNENGFGPVDAENIFCNLGKFCLQILQSSDTSAVEKFLQTESYKQLPLALKLDIFNKSAHSPKLKYQLYYNKLLTVFFATFFLQKKVADSKNPQDVIDEYFCPDGSIADFAVEESKKGEKKTYIVGIFPEIALTIKGPCYCFKMYHDIKSRIEMSTAFDSTNLLLRVSQKYLPRFGFEEISDESEISEIQGSFSDVINCLDFDGTIDMKFFRNNCEGKFYFVWTVEESDNQRSVLQGIAVKNEECSSNCSANLSYSKLHLSFLLSKADKYANVLHKLLQINTLNEFQGQFSLRNFILQIWKTVGTMNEKPMVIFSMYDSAYGMANHNINAESQGISFQLTKDISSIFNFQLEHCIKSFKEPLVVIYLK